MGDVVQHKIFICLTSIFGITVLTAVLLCIFQIKVQYDTADMHALRSDAGILINDIENSGDFKTDTTLEYAVILNNGTVVYNNGTRLNDHVNLHSLGSDLTDFYIVPLMKNESQYALLYIDISDKYYGKNRTAVLLWIFVSSAIIFISVIIYLMLLRVLKRDIFIPVYQLHTATRDIMNGKLDTKVEYDYDGETGTLCHDFELMRTELQDSFAREQKMKSDEKLLMASISHDLKTPLATVQGYLESICLDVVTDRQEIKRYCKNALNKTVLLGNMTNDILEHSKAELRQLTIEREEVYTGEYFGKLMQSLRSDADSRGMSLSYGDIPNIIISLDKTRIAQVMENIVGNSFKYGKSNGSIVINFRCDDRFFYVSVKDDGQGISAEDLPFVFNRFFRGDKARTQNVPGSGLGLSISKYIVGQHGGKIECDSILGQGTTIEFCIEE